VESVATRVVASVFSGVLGLLVGSFLNVVVYRLPRGESIVRPPSHCTTCSTQLSALENIPVLSWLALRGRCHHCRAPISPRYPVVELATAALFAGLAAALPVVEPLASLDAVIACAIATGIIGLDGLDAPAALGWVTLACSATLVAVSAATGDLARLGWAGIDAGAVVGAFGLQLAMGRAMRTDLERSTFVSCVAWGFAAGWVAGGGGLTIAAVWALLLLVGRFRGEMTRRAATATTAAASIATIVAGAIATR
jgi:leader peptidase (prepilin peptidase) / N-methyltransferase